MRAFLILCVAAFTLLTFYSALWFKSEDIETDITTRVTDELNTAGAKDVAIDVDGRHVTLSGVVYDEATETAYLDTANDTYGALGPIDGLTYLSGGGFVKAVKSDAGIKLSGSVPSEDARDSLVAAAGDATEGEVIDNLSIGGSAGDWEGEAGFGMTKLADLSKGALAVSPGSYTLSGLAKEDGSGVQAELSQRDGWQAFVSSPGIEEELTDEVTRLKANTSELDQRILALMGERDTLDTSVGGLTSERDALTASLAAVNTDYKTAKDERDAALAERDGVIAERDGVQTELDTLRASLDDNQNTAASLAADLETAKAGIAERDVTIEGLNGRIADLGTQNTDLNAELAAQKDALSADQQEVVSLRTKIDVQTQTITGLTADLDAKSAELADVQGNLSNLDANGAAANAKIAELTTALDGRTGEVADLTGKLTASEAQVATLEGQLADQGAGDAAAKAQMAALTAAVATGEANAANLGKQVDDLTAVVATRDATIESLRNASPTAVRGAAETAQQCSARAGEVLTDAQINFATSTANISRASVPTLERLTGITLACADSGLRVEIGGHTDSQGSDANNQALSERRANAVAKFMTDRGVPGSALIVAGYGEAKPIGDNATREGRAKNRRISFEWQAR